MQSEVFIPRRRGRLRDKSSLVDAACSWTSLVRCAFVVSIAIGISGITCASEVHRAAAPNWVREIPLDLTAEPPPGRTLDGVHYLLSDEQSQLDRAGRTTYRRLVSRAINQRGVESVAHISLEFDPSYETLKLNTLKVYRDSRTLDRLGVATVKVLQRETELDALIYDGAKTADISLDDIRPGDVVEYAYTLQGSNPAFNGDESGVVRMQWQSPVARLHRRLRVPAQTTLRLNAHNGAPQPAVATTDGWTEYTWDANNTKPATRADETPSWWVPYAYVEWSTYADWSAVARWAQRLYVAGPVSDPALASEIATIGKNAQSPQEKISGVLSFVQGNVRYLGIEMGAGSYAPRRAEEVFARRFGDCKDKVMLAVTMLRELGITAYPALVSTRLRDRLDEHLPMPTLFNHVVFVARAQGHEWWLDPTRPPQKGRLERVAQANYGRALVIDGTSMAPVTIPVADASIDRKQITLRLDASKGFGSPARLDVMSHFEGVAAERMRDTLRNENLEQLQLDYLNYYRRDYRGLRRVEPITTGENEAYNGLTTQEHYEIPTLLRRDNKGAPVAYIYARDMKSRLQPPDDSERLAPLAVSHPQETDVTLTIVLPDDRAIKPTSTTVRDKHFEFTAATSQYGREMRLEYTYRSLADHVDPGDLPAYVAHLEQARNNLGYTLRPAPLPAFRGDSAVGGILFFGSLLILWLLLWLPVRLISLWRQRKQKAAAQPVHATLDDAAARSSRNVLLLIAASFVIFGAVEGSVAGKDGHSVALAHAVFVGCSCYAWCRADARARGAYTPTRFVSLLAGLVPLVGLPVFLFKSRAPRAAWAGTGKVLLFAFAVYVAAALSTVTVALLTDAAR